MARSSVTKGKAFLYALSGIMLVFVGATAFGVSEEGVAKAAMTAIVALTTAFIAGNVSDNGVKGRFYNESLDKGK